MIINKLVQLTDNCSNLLSIKVFMTCYTCLEFFKFADMQMHMHQVKCWPFPNSTGYTYFDLGFYLQFRPAVMN